MCQVAYKYLKKRYADKMLYNGEIKIGTLSYYRNIENPAVADPNEGKMVLVKKVDVETVITEADDWASKIGPSFGKMPINMENGARLVLSKGTMVTYDKSIDDLYIYCVSMEYNAEMIRKFDADCCVEIYNVKGLQQIIHDELCRMKLVYPEISIAQPIQYIGHEFKEDPETSGHWLKDTKYSDEKEYRLTFLPIRKKDGKKVVPQLEGINIVFPPNCDKCNVDPKVVKNHNITKCCRRVDHAPKSA